ncbi:MAG: hypothetical protein E6I85_12675 [Chloroflexi bacterium]|nr:MAG: hypothetical protein E6I85_12675 [Chloroflexota bacterium]
MGELDKMAERMLAARDRLRAVPLSDSHELGPPDPKSGDRWDRFNVLGHTAEMLNFWPRELRKALDTGVRLGREPGSSSRIEGIEGGRLLGEANLRDRIDKGVEATVALLKGISESDLERELDTWSQERRPVRWCLEYYLVGHLEAHVEQLVGLPA